MPIGQRDTEIERDKVIERVQKNRDAHRDLYDRAMVGYRERVIEEIERMLADAQNGHIRHRIDLLIPEDHTEDYDRILDMLTLDVRKTVTLSEQEFAWYLRDDWQWKQAFLNSTVGMGYVAENAEYPQMRQS